MARLNGKVTLVTGAAQGIGAAIARAFVAEGATVVLTDLRDGPGAALAGVLGAAAHYRHLDVRREDDWAAATAYALDTFGRLDVVVNNAGITGFEEPAADGRPRTTPSTHRSRRGTPSLRRTSTAPFSVAGTPFARCVATRARPAASGASGAS